MNFLEKSNTKNTRRKHGWHHVTYQGFYVVKEIYSISHCSEIVQKNSQEPLKTALTKYKFATEKNSIRKGISGRLKNWVGT